MRLPTRRWSKMVPTPYPMEAPHIGQTASSPKLVRKFTLCTPNQRPTRARPRVQKNLLRLKTFVICYRARRGGSPCRLRSGCRADVVTAPQPFITVPKLFQGFDHFPMLLGQLSVTALGAVHHVLWRPAQKRFVPQLLVQLGELLLDFDLIALQTRALCLDVHLLLVEQAQVNGGADVAHTPSLP